MKLVVTAGLALLLFACSGGDSMAPPLSGFPEVDSGSAGSAGAAQDAGSDYDPPGSCPEGHVRSCSVTLPTQGDIKNCFVGKQLCSGGEWGPCSDLVLTDAAAP